MTVRLACLDDPICSDGLDLPEDHWLELALGVAIHRYFLHVDDPLTADFALDFIDRQHLFSSAKRPEQAEAKAALVRRIARTYGAEDAAQTVPMESGAVLALNPNRFDEAASTQLCGALRRAKTLRVHGIVELGAMGIVAGEGFASRPSWARLLGVVCVPSGLREEEVLRTMLGQATENVCFAFLYAGLREGYIFGDREGAVEEVADSLLHEYGDALLGINQLGTRLLDRSRPAATQAHQWAVSPLAASPIDYIPFADFINTLTSSQIYMDKYLRGLGVGQS